MFAQFVFDFYLICCKLKLLKLIFSSTNAYMLMYRRKDTNYNVTFDAPSQWPEHMIELREKLIQEEDDEIDKKSKDRDLCKV